MKYIFTFWCIFLAVYLPVRGQIITTVAGTGTFGSSGDGGPAVDAMVAPTGMATDKTGNLYFADQFYNRIRKINLAGIVITVAGNGSVGHTGDGGPATAAALSAPFAIAVDSSGDIFFTELHSSLSDTGYSYIRKINPSGIISTVAGNGTYGDNGDGGSATNAELGYICGLATDKFGNIYFSDYYYAKIRKIDAYGTITSYAGTNIAGYGGDGGPATSAQLSAPMGLAADTSGNLYIADELNYRIRKVSTIGVIATFAGGGFGVDGGPATSASLIDPLGVATDDAGNIYISDFWHSRIRRVNAFGIITTIAGNGSSGYTGDGGLATYAEILPEYGIAADHSGNIFTSASSPTFDRIRKIGPNHPPHFTRGHISSLTVCENSVAVSINSLLPVIDTDLEQKEIWSVVGAPAHGTFFVVDTILSTGDTLHTSAMNYYTPTGGYTGQDTFKVRVTDGIASDTTIVIVTVNPIGGITGASCIGSSGISTTLSDTTTGGVWTSGNTTVAIVGSGTGIVTGEATGTVLITYTVATGCWASIVVSVHPALPAISGPTSICLGSSSTMSDAAGTGIWSSANTSIAPIGSATAVVMGVAAGTAIISYDLGAGCITTASVRVFSLPVMGAAHVCTGAATLLSDTAAGGSWTSSSTVIATVGAFTGTVTGVTAGTTVITYMLGSGCRGFTAVTVNPIGVITGIAQACQGFTTMLSDAVTGGSWSIGDYTIASVGSSSGIVTGLLAATTTVTYTMPGTGCVAYGPITVNATPSPISGVTNICQGYTTTLSDVDAGGTWGSTNLSVATAGTGGIITGLATRADTIIYTLPTGCQNTVGVNVYASPRPINGVSALCLGTVTYLTDSSAGGTWASSNATVAPVITGSGFVSALAAGTAVITYTLGTGCFVTKTLTVVPYITPITGLAGLCGGTVTTLGESTGGGTWSSSNIAVATIGSTSGLLIGGTSGTASITYSLGGSCRVTRVETVYPGAAAITGMTPFCAGTTLSLHDATSGGTWSSGNTSVATVGSSGTLAGVVAGVIQGTAVITYTLGTGCAVTAAITVNGAPTAISGPGAVCVGQTIALTDLGGGTWSSGTTGVAGVGSSSGIVTGVAAGTATITYSAGAGCVVTKSITVYGGPAAITGTESVCAGATTHLFNTSSGGQWTSPGYSGIATVGTGTGVVTGVAAGTAAVTYTLTSGCATMATVTVNALPAAIGSTGSLSGGASVCAGAGISLTDATTGGAWSTTGTGVATLGSTGSLSGVSAGTVIVTYTLGTGCMVTRAVTVEPAPSAITGATAVCVGATTNLFDGVAGGAWSDIGYTGVATVGSTGALSAVVTGMNIGTALVSYTLASGCATTTVMTVVFAPSEIDGPSAVCVASTIYLGDEVIGGRWSSSATGIATVGTGVGIVAGVSAGTMTISYSLGTGCLVTKVITVNPLPAGITGTMHMCAGAGTTLGETTTGGTWTSGSTGVAAIGSTGSLSALVNGISAGTAGVTYTSGLGCKTTTTVAVNPLPEAIAGSLAVCTGASGVLTDGTAGGTWSTGGSIASISGGSVTGLSAGTEVVSYTLGTTCLTTAILAVNPLPAAILGVTTFCAGNTTTLYDSSSGGAWSATGAASIGTADLISAVVTGAAAGTATISYLAGGCLTHTTVGVNAVPGPIAGAANGCAGLTSLLTDGTGGGTWHISDTSVATLGASSGILTGITGGAVTISYTLITGCYATTGLTVNPTPTRITGPATVCSGANVTLADSTSGGAWSSGATAIAMASAGSTSSLSGVVTGVSAGTAVISYVIGGCGVNKTILVYPVPEVITGPDSMCEAGSTVTVHDATPSGAWTSIFVTVDTTGLVTSYSAGIGTVSYTLGTGCYATKAITILPVPDEISGRDYVCLGGVISLTDATVGGLWSSPGYGPFATIGTTSGVVTGIATGTANVTYTIPTGCFITKIISVNPLPGPVTGPASVCAGLSVEFRDVTAGGVWTSGAVGIAAVGATSADTVTVSGVSSGVASISYSVTNLCGTAVTTKSITVNPQPDPGTITGPASVCAGTQISLTDGIAGGLWGCSNANATVSGGMITGVTAGMDTVSYSVTNMCGTRAVTQPIAINPQPFAGTVTGADSLCPGDTASVGGTVSGGVWSSTNVNISTVSTTGLVTGVGPGLDTINYTVTNVCGSAVAGLPLAVKDAAECTNGSATVIRQGTSLRVYPNPNNGTFNLIVSSAFDESVVVTVRSILGVEVGKIAVKSNVVKEVRLDVAAGVYFISMATGERVVLNVVMR